METSGDRVWNGNKTEDIKIMEFKTDFEILADKNINSLRSTAMAQSELISEMKKEINSLKTGMVQMTNNFEQFKGQVQIMIANTFGSGPTKR